MYLSRLLALVVAHFTIIDTGHAIEWKSSFETHATGADVRDARRKAAGVGHGKLAKFKEFCGSFDGSLSYRQVNGNVLLESPGFPAEAWVSTKVHCVIDQELAPANSPEKIEGLYYSVEANVLIDLSSDLTFRTNFTSTYANGHLLEQFNQFSRAGNSKYYVNAQLTADGRCRTTVPVELEKLDDGDLIIKETAPHSLNWNFGCNWGNVFSSYFHLKPVQFTIPTPPWNRTAAKQSRSQAKESATHEVKANLEAELSRLEQRCSDGKGIFQIQRGDVACLTDDVCVRKNIFGRCVQWERYFDCARKAVVTCNAG